MTKEEINKLLGWKEKWAPEEKERAHAILKKCIDERKRGNNNYIMPAEDWAYLGKIRWRENYTIPSEYFNKNK